MNNDSYKTDTNETEQDKMNVTDVPKQKNDYLNDCLLYPVSFCICCICWCSYGCPRPRKCVQYINNFLEGF